MIPGVLCSVNIYPTEAVRTVRYGLSTLPNTPVRRAERRHNLTRRVVRWTVSRETEVPTIPLIGFP